MAKRNVSNLLGLAVLSLLTERPMHPYEMSAIMRQRDVSSAIKLNQSSLYSVIEALQREEWIVPVETQREGRYPERTIYTTTEAGREEFADWLRSLIQRPATEYTQFAAGLTFLGHLPPTEAATLLQEHAHSLQEQIRSSRSLIEKTRQLGVDRLFLVEDAYTLTLLEAKLAFVQHLIQEINDGTLTETRDDKRIWKITRPELALLESEEKQKKIDDGSPQKN